jgi:hypothetical protein
MWEMPVDLLHYQRTRQVAEVENTMIIYCGFMFVEADGPAESIHFGILY